MYISNRVLKAVLGLAVTAIIGACSDAPTAPSTKSSALKPGGAQKIMELCDPYSFTCDSGGGGSYVAPVDNRIYLHFFEVVDCDPLFTQECTRQTINQGYYEIRQNLYEANGTWIGYNKQRWNGWAGTVDIPIFDTRICAGSGRYLNVEIYELGVFNSATRIVSFNVYAGDRDRLLTKGNRVTWTAYIGYHWDAC